MHADGATGPGVMVDGRYLLQSQLGGGGAAMVWLAESTVCPVWNVHFAVSVAPGAVFSV